MSSLTEEQQLIFNNLIGFLKDKSKFECLINSSAGVGKTYTIIQFLKYVIDENLISKKICVSSPTHTSLSILKCNIHQNNIISPKIEISTVHRLLNYKQKISRDGEKYFSRNTKIKLNWYKYDIIIIDECSMLSDDICDDIFQQIDNYKNTNKILKVIYLGDISQINPVNHSISKVFTRDIETTLVLNKIVRTKNEKIMKLAKAHKLWDLEDKIPNISKYVSENVILFEDKKIWLVKFLKEFDKSPNNIILCWTNKQKDEYNNYIREMLFKKKSLNRYEINEILIFSDFFQLKINIINENEETVIKNINFYTSQQIKIIELNVIEIELKKMIITKTKKISEEINNLIITNLEKINELLNTKIKVYKLIIQKLIFQEKKPEPTEKDTMKENFVENEPTYCLNTIHESSEKVFTKIKNDCSEIIVNIKDSCYKYIDNIKNKDKNEICNIQNEIEIKIGKIWDNMNIIIDEIAKLNYSYAITIHLSQSKTYNNVYIDINDVFRNDNLSEKKKLLYTAITRASNSLNLLIL
jgi:hypothetical protein